MSMLRRPLAEEGHDRFRPVRNTELAIDGSEVELDRMDRDSESRTDVAVRPAEGDDLEDLPLSPRQARQSSTIRGGRGDSDVVGQIHVVMVGAPGRTRYGQLDRTSARVTHQMARLQSGVSGVSDHRMAGVS